MSDIVTILTELLMKAQEELTNASSSTNMSIIETKIKQLEIRLDRVLFTADL